MIQCLGQHPRNVSGFHWASYSVRTNGKFNGGVAVRYTTENRRYLPFPPNTYGYLYYKGPKPGYPDFSGSLRFRVVPMSDPYSFAAGKDLRLPTGSVWQILLYSAVRSVKQAELVTKLLEEGLVTDSAVEKARGLPNIRLRSASRILYKLEDPFCAELQQVNRIVVMSEDDAQCGQMTNVFKDLRGYVNKHPYTGMPSYQPPECQLQDT